MIKLSELKYLKYLNDVKFLVVIFLIVGGIYLMVKSPTIKTTMELQLYKDSIVQDSIKLDTNAHR